MGAVHSRIGLLYDRATVEGRRQASHAFIAAVGAFAYLSDKAASEASMGMNTTVDVSVECAGMLEKLMLAQAQEYVFENIIAKGSTPGVCAKISRQIESALPTLARPIISLNANEDAIVGFLKQSLRQLEILGAQHAGLEDVLKEMKRKDDILPKLMTSTGAYEGLFKKEVAKYDHICVEITQNIEAQEQLLFQVQNEELQSLILKIIKVLVSVGRQGLLKGRKKEKQGIQIKVRR